MPETLVKFEREGQEGLVAVGTYLIDAARRFGIRMGDDPVEESAGDHSCSVFILSGAELLSEETKIEREHFAVFGRKSNERLACQTKIEKPGEVTIMTKEKSAESTAADDKEASERFRKEFEEMSLEAKIASLVKLEVIALGETISFVANSPFKVFEKLMDVMAEFGLKKDAEAKSAARPEEHKKKSEKGKSGAAPDAANGSTA
ncbi:MAG: hypothetical protein ACR2IH_06515 [Pyrinomonadaceae bacterium]